MKRNQTLGLLALLLLIVAAFGVYTTSADSDGRQATADALTLEVAINPNTFAFTQDRLFDDGLPNYGTPFIIQGYIYPQGTLSGSNGTLADGQPEFPDQVIGEWTCYGWFVGQGAHTTTGDVVVTTQVFKLMDEADTTIVTLGFEAAEPNVSVARAITGGTGTYAGASGEQLNTLLGFTAQGAGNITAEFHFTAP